MPIDAQNVGVQAAGCGQERGPMVGKVDQGNIGMPAQFGQHFAHIGQSKDRIVLRRERPGPGIEELQGLGPGPGLRG